MKTIFIGVFNNLFVDEKNLERVRFCIILFKKLSSKVENHQIIDIAGTFDLALPSALLIELATGRTCGVTHLSVTALPMEIARTTRP